ncbi:MAG: hypothetical protein CMM52_17210 [Rhodospirillaceae bacterium]|nr:hypothetical protein [Rhodospirillaceae bacterium]
MGRRRGFDAEKCIGCPVKGGPESPEGWTMTKAVWLSVWRALNFERVALVFTGLSVVTLYALVLTQPPATPPKSVKKESTSDHAGIRPLSDSEWQRETKRSAVKPIGVLSIAPTKKLKKVFDQIGYRLDTVRTNQRVPRLFLATLPKDLPEIRQPTERKNVFVMMTLPLVLHVNELILQTRSQLKAIQRKQQSGQAISIEDQRYLEKVAEEYGLEKPLVADLLKRVDIIPPSLALAQSAEESGWGTSRFAREGNALFGQRTWRSTTGIIPKKREDGKKFKVRVFDHLLDGVKAYARNLNGHPYYKNFRNLRAEMRETKAGKIDGMKLAATLLSYSERGADYVKTIQAIIRINHFTVFDEARLLDKLDKTLQDLTSKPSSPDA